MSKRNIVIGFVALVIGSFMVNWSIQLVNLVQERQAQMAAINTSAEALIIINQDQPMEVIDMGPMPTPFVTGMEAIGIANEANLQAIADGHPELVDCRSASAFAAPAGCETVPLSEPVPAQGP
jgi:hypothetical protein